MGVAGREVEVVAMEKILARVHVYNKIKKGKGNEKEVVSRIFH